MFYIKKNNPEFYFCFTVFLACILVNYLNLVGIEHIITYPDTETYLEFAQKLQNWQMPNVQMRLPVYPLFLIIAGWTGDWAHVIWFQMIFGALAAVCLYRIARIIFKRVPSFIVSVFIMSDFSIINWHAIALTESLASSLIVIWVYVQLNHIHQLQDISRKNLFWLVPLCDLLLMFIKHSLFFLPILWYGYLLLKKLLRGNTIKYFVSEKILNHFLLLSGISLLWCFIVYLSSGTFTLTEIASTNQLGKLMSANLLTQEQCTKHTCSEITKNAIQLYQKQIPDKSPWRLLTSLQLDHPTSDRLSLSKIINSELSKEEHLRLIVFNLKLIPEILRPRAWYQRESQIIRWKPYISYSEDLARISGILSIYILLFGSLIAMKDFFRSQNDWLNTILTFVTGYVIFVSTMGSYDEFGRLISITLAPLHFLGIKMLSTIATQVNNVASTSARTIYHQYSIS